MARISPALVAVALCACGPTLVANRPSMNLISGTGSPKEVREAVVRALSRDKLTAESEAAASIVAVYDKKVRCRYSVEYTDTQFIVASLDPTPQAPAPEQVDERCQLEAQRLVKLIVREVGRPAREAKEAEAKAMEHERKIAEDRRRAAEAALAQERMAQQAAQQAQDQYNQPPPQIVLPVPNPALLPMPAQGVNVNANVQQGSSEQSYTCCINGAQYSCPSRDAFNECVSHGPRHCTRNGTCH